MMLFIIYMKYIIIINILNYNFFKIQSSKNVNYNGLNFIIIILFNNRG